MSSFPGGIFEEKLSQGLGKPTVFLGVGVGSLRTQRVRWNETLAKPNPKLLSPHTLYYTNISWYTVPNGSARLQAPVSQGLNRDSLKSLNISRFSGLVGRRSLSPGLLPASAGILDLGGKQDDDVRNSFVGHQRGHSDSWLALLPEIMEE